MKPPKDKWKLKYMAFCSLKRIHTFTGSGAYDYTTVRRNSELNDYVRSGAARTLKFARKASPVRFFANHS